MIALLVTPRQIGQIRTAIRECGLLEAEFSLQENKEDFKIKFSNTDFYFQIALQRVTPSDNPTAGQFLSAAIAVLNPFETRCVPDLTISGSGIYRLPKVQIAKNFEEILQQLRKWLAWIKKEYGPFEQRNLLAVPIAEVTITFPSLPHLHPTVEQVAGKLFADAHYPQAIQVACTALEKAIQQKGGLRWSTWNGQGKVLTFSVYVRKEIS